MFNYLIKIEYEGTNFVGWQSQKNGRSVQDSIETALKKVLNTKIKIIGAGRTDKGVHAYSQFANFKLKKKIDLRLMRKGAKILEGTHNFSTFRAASCSAKSPIKKIYPIKISKINEIIKIRITSKSFLQNQVRSMVGCLKYLGEGKWSLGHFKKAFKSCKRKMCATPAPPQGLYLTNVSYN